MSDNIIRQDYGTLGADVQTQTLIAPVLVDMVADRAFAVGDQFIVDSVLYKATAIIAQDDPLVVGTNCEVSDTVTEQIETLSQKEERTEGIVNTLTNNGTALIPRNEGYVALAANTWTNIANVGSDTYRSYLVISTYNNNRGMWIVTKTSSSAVTSYEIAKENSSTTISFGLNSAGTIIQMKSSSNIRISVIFIGNS